MATVARTLLVTLALVALLPLSASGRAPKPARGPSSRLTAVSPDGRRVAEVRARPRGGEAVWIEGRPRWPEPKSRVTPRVTSQLVWSREGDALAFIAREPVGAKLVVVVVDSCRGCDTVSMSWPIPASAMSANVITWLGPTKVSAGPRPLQPQLVASFRVE